jgi:hypothetical protein
LRQGDSLVVSPNWIVSTVGILAEPSC